MINSALITKASVELDRSALLQRLGFPTDVPIIGDIADTSPISLDVGPSLKQTCSMFGVLGFGQVVPVLGLGSGHFWVWGFGSGHFWFWGFSLLTGLGI